MDAAGKRIMRKLILEHKFALGDCVCFTALPRDIHAAYPGQFDIAVDSHFSEVWWNNPHARMVKKEDYQQNPLIYKISYRDGITAAGRGQKIHMVAWYHHDFSRQSGYHVPVTVPSGDIHMTAEESKPIVEGRYWVMLSGGKMDITIKHWWVDRWQRVVDMLLERGVHCVRAGVLYKDHVHPPMKNVIDMVGKYDNARGFFNLIQNSEGIMCPITAGMHIAACFEKPCVIVAGGREEPWWEGYVNCYGAFGPGCQPVKVEHRYLHTIGSLDCCKTKGCWKHRVVPLGRNDKWDKPFRICKMPISTDTQHVAKCMDMITPEHVVNAVMSYYADGTLPPVGEPVVVVKKHEMPQIVPVNQLPVRPILLPFDEPAAVGERATPVIVRPPLPTAKQAKPEQLKPPTAKPVTAPAVTSNTGWDRMDHPLIGGKLTVFALCYGPHPELARSCLSSILETVPIERLDIRVGCNACDPATIKYLESLPLTKMYVHKNNDKKYPVMREMFWDTKCPVTTRYMAWFDDDAKVADRLWALKLSDAIISNHPHGSRLYGNKYVHDLKMFAKGGHNPVEWFKRAAWWRGRNLKVKGQGDEAPNGTVIEFVSGWFWAASMDAIRAANVPDIRLNHNGGDIAIGEQFHQAGFKIKTFNTGKSLVWCPEKQAGGRRGYSEKFQWQT